MYSQASSAHAALAATGTQLFTTSTRLSVRMSVEEGLAQLASPLCARRRQIVVEDLARKNR